MAGRPEFVDRFDAAWREPRTKFVELFAPEGTLYQAGMERPIRRDEIAAHQEVTLRLMPDIRTVATHWGVAGEDVLIEWKATATFLGAPVVWEGASRFTLRDGMVVEERAYFDTFPLRARANPAMAMAAQSAAELAAAAGG